MERPQLGINGGRVGFSGGRPVQGDYSARYGAIRGSFSIDVVLQALQEEGLVTIMAEPNLTARSGESADFLAGGEYPYSPSATTEPTSSSRTSASG